MTHLKQVASTGVQGAHGDISQICILSSYDGLRVRDATMGSIRSVEQAFCCLRGVEN
jgi:hypothetical protein